LLAGAAWLSANLTHNARRQAKIYAGILRLMQYIAVEISCFGTARETLFSSFQDEVLEKCGFLPALRRLGRMREALAESGVELIGGDAALLAAFDEALGTSFRDEQLTVCAYYVDRWKERERTVREGLPSRVRLARTVTLSCGMLLLLLLL
jgi:hypothetical protein